MRERAGELCDFKARGGGEGGEVRREEERDEGKAAEAGMWNAVGSDDRGSADRREEDQSDNKESDEGSGEKKTDNDSKNQSSYEVYPSGAQSELLNESTIQTGS